ncbi:MAG: prepilin peptidase [Pirellulaceae bacterium]|jgi:hypothetical protein|nr:prepilin peptidase [Pirellulaceae bacterium]
MLLAWSTYDIFRSLPDAMQIFLGVWLFAVGACVGSFVNVVALRLPVGEQIARSSSRCPVCRHLIRWYDNIPLLSWLRLRGRCRDCGTRIPLRYPVVELLAGLLFLALALGEGLVAGRNLPLAPGGPRYVLWSPWQIWTLYAYHSLLLTTLLTAALFRFDGHVPPPTVFAPVLTLGLLGVAVLGWLHPASAVSSAAGDTRALGQALQRIVWGLGMGVAMGVCSWPATGGRSDGCRGAPAEIWACMACGVGLGYQAVVAVVFLAAWSYLGAALLSTRWPRLAALPWSGHLTGAGLLYIMQWRRWVEWLPALGPAGALGDFVLPALIVAAASLAAKAWMRALPRPAATKGEHMDLIDPEQRRQAILHSPSYLPVEFDAQFLQQPELRPVRVQLELLKPELALAREGVASTVVVFGGTQIVPQAAAQQELERARTALADAPGDVRRQRHVQRLERIVAKAHYYDAAREFARLVSQNCQIDGRCDYVVITGGGPGIMEAANRGAFDAGAKSIGLNVTLPAEQVPNPYITPELCFQFHYFALRKMHFLLRAKALVIFPGGFGTLDELFDALTLRQTERMQVIPIILFGRDYWNRVIDFQFLADEGVVADEHLDLISFAETPQEAWDIIARFHHHADR